MKLFTYSHELADQTISGFDGGLYVELYYKTEKETEMSINFDIPSRMTPLHVAETLSAYLQGATAFNNRARENGQLSQGPFPKIPDAQSWQLDQSNDYWLYVEGDKAKLSCRYPGQEPVIEALAALFKVRFRSGREEAPKHIQDVASEGVGSEDRMPRITSCCYVRGGHHRLQLAFSREVALDIYNMPGPSPLFLAPKELEVAKAIIHSFPASFPNKRTQLDDDLWEMISSCSGTNR